MPLPPPPSPCPATLLRSNLSMSKASTSTLTLASKGFWYLALVNATWQPQGHHYGAIQVKEAPTVLLTMAKTWRALSFWSTLRPCLWRPQVIHILQAKPLLSYWPWQRLGRLDSLCDQQPLSTKLPWRQPPRSLRCWWCWWSWQGRRRPPL